MSKILKIFLLVFPLGLMTLPSCGADHHETKAVTPMLDDHTLTLKQKMKIVCGHAASQDLEPNLENAPFLEEACLAPNSQSQIFDPETPVGFSDSDIDGYLFSTENEQLANKDKTWSMYLRAQIRLNKSSTMTLAEITKRFKQHKNSTTPIRDCHNVQRHTYFSMLELPDINSSFSRASFAGLLMNLKKFNMTADVCNHVDINIERIGSSFIISAKTINEGLAKDTLLKNGKALIFLVPHAGEVYAEILINAEMHSYGVDRIMFDVAKPMIGKGISNMIKFLVY